MIEHAKRGGTATAAKLTRTASKEKKDAAMIAATRGSNIVQAGAPGMGGTINQPRVNEAQEENPSLILWHAKDPRLQSQQIVQEQARLRDNLARVPANSDLQRRYLATLDKQETELETIAKRRADAEKAMQVARDTLRSYVSQLS